jgi:undecaprenyl-diphosphatase
MGKPTTATEPVAVTLEREARFGVAFLRKYGLRLLLLLAGLVLPLWGFAELADELREGEPFAFDEPILRFARGLANSGFDRMFLLFSAVGYRWGVVPFDIVLVLVLAVKRHAREGLFAGLALAGSAVLNIATKHAFARTRPSLWESIAPETTFSFPSGHAMGSMTLAWVCLLLAWRTRWRWPVTIVAVLFTVMVGLSRIYLGVHYPSDILAGWTAASVWAASCFLLVFRHDRHPWQGRGIPSTP